MGNLTATQELMVAAAWADGKLNEREASFLRRVLANGSVGKSQIEMCLAHPTVRFDDVLERLDADGRKQDVMQEVLRICVCEGLMGGAESDLVERLRSHLGLDRAQVEALKAGV